MQQYWIEGLFATRQGVRKERKTGVLPPSDIELFARAVWANSPDEAIRLATEALNGGQWIETPRLSQVTEEQRMRAMGAPELPGLTAPSRQKRTRS
jgi:hypothetical protein